MSVFNIKSKVIANRDAVPPLLSNPEVAQGTAKVVLGVEKTTNLASNIGDAGTAIRLITLPSNSRLQILEYATGALGTSSLDIAAWYPTSLSQGAQNSPAASLAGTVIASSIFATALAGVDTSRGWTDAMGVNATPALNLRGQTLWQMLGLANDPGVDIDMGFTVRTAVAINGYVGLRATYVD